MTKDKREVMEGERIVFDETKKVTKFGTGGHVTIDKQFVGEKARVIIQREWRICQQCSQTFSDKKNFAPDKRYCAYCYNKIKNLEKLKKKGKLKCRVCSKGINEGDYWSAWGDDICEDCWINQSEVKVKPPYQSQIKMKEEKS